MMSRNKRPNRQPNKHVLPTDGSPGPGYELQYSSDGTTAKERAVRRNRQRAQKKIEAEPAEFFVLSIKHTKRSDGLLTFWGPNNSGYKFRIDGTRCPAGRYTRAQIESQLGYYHDEVNTLAIPCADVEAASIRVGDCVSRSVDMIDVDDRVVPFGKLRKLKSVALAWRKTGNEQ